MAPAAVKSGIARSRQLPRRPSQSPSKIGVPKTTLYTIICWPQKRSPVVQDSAATATSTTVVLRVAAELTSARIAAKGSSPTMMFRWPKPTRHPKLGAKAHKQTIPALSTSVVRPEGDADPTRAPRGELACAISAQPAARFIITRHPRKPSKDWTRNAAMIDTPTVDNPRSARAAQSGNGPYVSRPGRPPSKSGRYTSDHQPSPVSTSSRMTERVRASSSCPARQYGHLQPSRSHQTTGTRPSASARVARSSVS